MAITTAATFCATLVDEWARAAWSDRLERHAQIVSDGLRRFDGNLVKSTGDGALATFAVV